MTSRRVALLIAALLVVPLALGQGTYTQIDVPGGYETNAYAINSAGEIAGTYFQAGAPESGFVLSGGIYTTIYYLFSAGTSVSGINDLGQLVGAVSFTGSKEVYGFLYDMQTQTYSAVQYPGSLYTFPQAINDAGTIVGEFSNRKGVVGFEVTGSTYTPIQTGGANYTYATGISTAGQVVGNASSPTKSFNYSFYQGKYHVIAIPNEPSAEVWGVNPSGTAFVGSYPDSSGNVSGFVYQNKTLTILQFPGAKYTFPFSINDSGEVVGYFQNSDNSQHGFTWTPPADAARK